MSQLGKSAAFTLVVAVLGVSPAIADVDITPDALDPKLNLRTEKQWRGDSNRGSQSSKQATHGSQVVECNFDGPRPDCALLVTDAPAPARPALTPGRVARAVREVPMPRLRLAIQPGGRTLVNVPTILHTRPTTLRRTIDLLGHEVEVRATPVRYTWHHGDGTARTTRSPGKPYPAKTVTHRYRKSSPRLLARVDTTYTVRYRVDGGAWTGLGDTLTATGPSVGLRVDQRAPALIDR